jgi:diguanylate cyclase (GGDEF)-like protein
MHSLSSDTIYALYVTSDTAWIGTRGGGLNRTTWNPDLNAPLRFETLTEANGLPNNTVYGVVPDSAGTLWLSTNHGLARLDPGSGKVSNYYRNHGLQADEFNFGAHGRTHDGLLLFGGVNGYNAFDPLNLQVNRSQPSVAITAILKLGRPMRVNAGDGPLKPLHFGYRDDMITFEFAALDFAVPTANLFEYRLQGFDRTWVRTGPLHSATYTHLPGGHYSLQVRAANADGVWNTRALEVPLDVDPPPWKTPWAYTSYSLLVALLIYWVWSRQKRALARAASYRNQLEREVQQRTHQLAERNQALQKANALLERASFCDPLTGLGNRRSLDHAMPGLIADLERNAWGDGSGSRLAVLLIDLDRLKPINDQYGHEAGDRLLIEVAAILKECARGSDEVVRWGGDEFVIVHPVCDLEGTAALAERIRLSVAKRRFQVGGTTPGRTSCSIGFTLYPFIPGAFPRLGWERALSIADANLYRAKSFRNAWIGCCGTRIAADAVDIEALAERDLDAAERNRYVEVRRSAPWGDETVELLLGHSVDQRASTPARP